MKVITSPNNEYIKRLCKLKQKKYREEEKLFLIEGYNLVKEAQNHLKTVLVSSEKDIDYCKGPEYILVSDEVIKKLSETTTPQGIIGVCNMIAPKEKDFSSIIMLDGVQDPGNIGTIIRTALAFDFDAVYLSEDSVDVYNEKLIRATEGAFFSIPVIKKDLSLLIDELKKQDYLIIGTTLTKATSINNTKRKGKIAIVLGNEGNGISKEILLKTDVNVFIPISPKMESLNVAIAGAITMYYYQNREDE